MLTIICTYICYALTTLRSDGGHHELFAVTWFDNLTNWAPIRGRRCSMANPLYKDECEVARLEGYAPLDLHKSGDLCYGLKRHKAPENRHASGCGQEEIKKDVLSSPRMRQVIVEVLQERFFCTLICYIPFLVTLPAPPTLHSASPTLSISCAGCQWKWSGDRRCWCRGSRASGWDWSQDDVASSEDVSSAHQDDR